MTAYSADRDRHARDLAAAFNVALCVMDIAPEAAGASTKPQGGYNGVVKCGRIVDDTTYAAALHEIGHVVAPLGGLSTEKRHLTGSALYRMILIEERAAWEWAQHYAHDWTPAMEQIKLWALSTYEAGYAQAVQQEQRRIVAESRPQMKVNMGTAAFVRRMEKL